MTKPNQSVSFRAFLIVLVTLAIFSVFYLIEAAPHGVAVVIIAAAFLVIVYFFIAIMHGRSTKEAFNIPLVLFLANTVRSLLTGDYSYYFPVSLVISCLGTLFFNRYELIKFIIVSNLIIAAQIIFKDAMFRPGVDGLAAMTLFEKLYDWFIFLIGSVSVCLVTAFAEDKNNDARYAQDSFVGALSSTPDPMILLDSQNRVTYISNSFMKMIHMESSARAKGRSVFDLLKKKNLWDLFYDILTAGKSFHTTREVILDGQQFFFEIVVARLTNEASGYLVNIVDITPVMKAKFDAEAASRSKSAFLATMSHEIRTPLNAIIGLSEIELQKDLPVDTHSDLERIYNSGGSLLAIINDILDISKIEAGNFELIPMDYDVPSLVNDTVHLNIVRIGSKNITFKLKIDETIPTRLVGDELRIKQILSNLLSNAIKYTEEGSVTLTITWEKQDDHARVIFSIADTGIGIKKEDIPKLFSEYQQLNARANRHIEGTGLGLSITRNLVSLMGGSVSAESEYGKGSVFTVRIMQRIIDETPIGAATAQNLESFRFRETYQNKSQKLVRSYMPYGKVLVVDDVETNLDVAKGLLLPYGLSIDTASSGPEAIEKIRAVMNDDKSRYDLIFMDHMMPGMDGLETVKIIRHELPGDYGRIVPIIALTANALAGNDKMFIAHGFSGFIPKPINLVQLDSALNIWIKSKQSKETLRKAEMELAQTTESALAASGDLSAFGGLDDTPVADIDFERGMERYGSEAIYLDILRSWHRSTPPLLEKMRGLICGGLPDYAITVHGLKGSSYGIFADAIGKKAEELEHLAKDGNFSDVQAGNAVLIEMAESLLRDLGALLEKAGKAADKVADSKVDSNVAGKARSEKIAAPDSALLVKLLEAAKQYKTTLMEEILESLESHDYESGGELVAWLREQMNNLEYDAICTRLENPVTH